MRNLLTGVATATLLIPAAVQAEIAISGTAFLGYYDDGYGKDGTIARSDINMSGEYQAGSDVKLGFSLDVDVIAAGKDPYAQQVSDQVELFLDDYTIYADFGVYGKLSYTTEGHCTTEETAWFDGEIYSENNTSVWNILPPNYRCVGGRSSLVAFPAYSLPANDYFKYEGHFGKFGVEVYYDPDRDFTDNPTGQTISGDDTLTVINGDEAPTAELNLSYSFPFMTVVFGATDLSDKFVRFVAPMPQYDLLLVASREWQAGDTDNPLTIGYADWSPSDLGVFKGATFLYFYDESSSDHESYVGQFKFGGDNWATNIGYDIEGDWAVEASYDINDQFRVLAGYDNGMNGSNGMDRFYGGAPDPNVGYRFAEDRGSSWEIGLEMKF